MTPEYEDTEGADNLLKNCMNIGPDNRVLLVCEDPQLGWYDAEIKLLLARRLEHLGISVSTVEVGSPDDPLPANYADLIEAHDTVIFLARIGDQDRFSEVLPGKNVAMLYTRDAGTLTSAYGSTDHQAMVALKQAVDAVTLSASHITLTCPLGTELECNPNRQNHQNGGDVAVKRFPLCVPQPVLANTLNGKVALARWLTPTGSRSYLPSSCQFETVVTANVRDGRITGFEGNDSCVDAIEEHYAFVSEKFGIDKDFVHSWHAGIHPACSFTETAGEYPDRWSNNIFGSPRFLHFHTCGNYPPGEICWMIQDPTIVIDGVALWDKGRLAVENFGVTKSVTERWPELVDLFAAPRVPVGIDA